MFVLRVAESEPCLYCSCLRSHLNILGSLEADIFSCEVAAWLTRPAASVIMSSRLEKYKPIKISSRLHQTDLAIIWKWGCFFWGFFFCANTTPESFLCFLFQVLVTQLQNMYWNEKQLDASSSAKNTEQFKRGKKQCQAFTFCRHRLRVCFFFRKLLVFFFKHRPDVNKK